MRDSLQIYFAPEVGQEGKRRIQSETQTLTVVGIRDSAPFRRTYHQEDPRLCFRKTGVEGVKECERTMATSFELVCVVLVQLVGQV